MLIIDQLSPDISKGELVLWVAISTSYDSDEAWNTAMRKSLEVEQLSFPTFTTVVSDSEE